MSFPFEETPALKPQLQATSSPIPPENTKTVKMAGYSPRFFLPVTDLNSGLVHKHAKRKELGQYPDHYSLGERGTGIFFFNSFTLGCKKSCKRNRGEKIDLVLSTQLLYFLQRLCKTYALPSGDKKIYAPENSPPPSPVQFYFQNLFL